MKLLKLKDLVNNCSCSYGDDLEKYNDVIPVVKVSNVNREGYFKNNFEKRSFPSKKLDKLLAQEGDLLVVKSSGSKLNILSGKTAIVNKKLSNNIVSSNFLLRLSPRKDKVFPKYLWYLLNSQFSRNYVKTIVGATTYPNLKWDLYSKHPVPYVDICEQKEIVKILDTADNLRQKRKEQLLFLDDYLKSIFLDMFGGKEKYPRKKMLELAEDKKGSMRTGPFGSALKHSEFVDHGIAVLGIDNAVDNEFKWKRMRYITVEKYQALKRYTVYPGDVLITIMGTLGRSAVVPDDIPIAINTKHLACISLNRKIANSYFISYSTVNDPNVTQQLKRNTRGAIMGGLNLTIIKDLNLYLPPIELQKKFISIMKQVEKTKQKMRDSLNEMDNQFNALMQRYFE